ncbi:MAG: hypothetical protein Q9213_006102, partial [Squamulea squamosa]
MFSPPSSSFAQTRAIYFPIPQTRVVIPLPPLDISPPPDFAQTCSPFSSPTSHTSKMVRFRPPISRPIIISSPLLDDGGDVETPLSPLRFGTPPSPAILDPFLPDWPEAGDELDPEDLDDCELETETQRSTCSADYVMHMRGTKVMERERARRGS